MDLHALQDFVLVAQHGGISAASRATGRSKATLSRQVTRLESDLNVRLVERGASYLKLTDDGKALQVRAQELLVELNEATDALKGRDRPAEGLLRLSAPLLFTHVHLGALSAAFVARHPRVLLEAQVEDRRVDLVHEGFDVVIRVNPPPTHGLVGRCILTDRQVLVATPDVAARYINHSTHRIPTVALSSMTRSEPWVVKTDGQTREISSHVVLKLPSYAMIRSAVLEGAGAAGIPESIVKTDLQAGKLVQLGTISRGETEIWVLHTARRLTSMKVNAFVQFATAWFKNDDRMP